jgi:hypothetical protein
VDAVKDIFDNEKAVMGLAILVAATVLVALGSMPIALWTDLAKWIFGFYAAGTAVYKSAVALSLRSAPSSAANTSAPATPPQ